MGKYQRTIVLLFDWFGISCMTTDNFLFLFAKQTNPNQSNRRSWANTSFLWHGNNYDRKKFLSTGPRSGSRSTSKLTESSQFTEHISIFCLSFQNPFLNNSKVSIPENFLIGWSVCPHLRSSTLGLPTNTRVGWKSLPGTNTLAYYGNP